MTYSNKTNSLSSKYIHTHLGLNDDHNIPRFKKKTNKNNLFLDPFALVTGALFLVLLWEAFDCWSSTPRPSSCALYLGCSNTMKQTNNCSTSFKKNLWLVFINLYLWWLSIQSLFIINKHNVKYTKTLVSILKPNTEMVPFIHLVRTFCKCVIL